MKLISDDDDLIGPAVWMKTRRFSPLLVVAHLVWV